MFKLAVFDLDGTLLDRHHEISEANIEAIRKLSEAGCEIVIATGRPDMLVREYVKTLAIKTPVISCNGALIRDAFTLETIHSKIIPKSEVLKILDLCVEDEHIYMVYTSDAIVTTDNFRTRYFLERNKKLDESCRATFIIENDVNRITETYEVFKILIIERDKDKYEIMNDKLKTFGNVTKVSSAKGFYDIMPLNTSKKHAIDQLIDHYNIELSQVVAFGDNYNDVEMLEHVGTAITTANGVEVVKEIADYVSIDHHNSGVAHAINHYIFNSGGRNG